MTGVDTTKRIPDKIKTRLLDTEVPLCRDQCTCYPVARGEARQLRRAETTALRATTRRPAALCVGAELAASSTGHDLACKTTRGRTYLYPQGSVSLPRWPFFYPLDFEDVRQLGICLHSVWHCRVWLRNFWRRGSFRKGRGGASRKSCPARLAPADRWGRKRVVMPGGCTRTRVADVGVGNTRRVV